MFLKKKVPVSEYCEWSLVPLFSEEREVTWEQLRIACADSALSVVNKEEYFAHIRAVILELMLIAIGKNSKANASFDARVYVSNYLSDHGLMKIDVLCGEYSKAFGTPGKDGIEQIVICFSHTLTNSEMKEETVRQFVVEFYTIMRGFFEEFKSIRLTPMRR